MNSQAHPQSSFSILLAGVAVALVISGCSPSIDATYGKSRGTSVNGTSVLARMLRERKREVRTAIRLNDELADWATGIIRFAPYPGPPSLEEARWYRDWLALDRRRRLIYVVRDFDAVAEYWQSVQATLTDSDQADRLAEAQENEKAAAGWVAKLPAKAKHAADSREWFATDLASEAPRVCTTLGGPWARDIDAAAARLVVHESIKSRRGLRLLEGDGKPLVIEKVIGMGKMLAIANGSFLLNESLVNAARRPLAERAIDWICDGTTELAVIEGASVLGGEPEPVTIWSLLRRISSFRWVAIQVGLAALASALARAPRLGRPRPDPRSGEDRPAEHALALGILLAKAKASAEARELLDRYHRWRFPRTAPAADHQYASAPEGARSEQKGAADSPTST